LNKFPFNLFCQQGKKDTFWLIKNGVTKFLLVISSSISFKSILVMPSLCFLFVTCTSMQKVNKNRNVQSICLKHFLWSRLGTEFHDLLCNYVGSASAPLFSGLRSMKAHSSIKKINIKLWITISAFWRGGVRLKGTWQWGGFSGVFAEIGSS
jgi:hypothetical protein